MYKGQLPSVQVTGSWWSKRGHNIAVSIVTQLAVDRLKLLESQCLSWDGPISAVVYYPLIQNVADIPDNSNMKLLVKAARRLSELHTRMEAVGHCSLDLSLVYELFRDRRATNLYPINLLRNLARLQARTELIVEADVDMMVANSLAEDFRDARIAEQLVAQARDHDAFVLPAFEVLGITLQEREGLSDDLLRCGKACVHDAVSQGLAYSLSERFFDKGGQSPVDVTAWFNTNKPQRINYTAGVEPWFLAHRMMLPWHDVRLRGTVGSTRSVEVAAMATQGFSFMTLPDGYILHRAHRPSVQLRRELTRRQRRARYGMMAERADSLLSNFENEGRGRDEGDDEDNDDEDIRHMRRLLWRKSGMQFKVDESWELLAEVMQGLQEGLAASLTSTQQYKPVLDDSVHSCLRSLPWWQGSSSAAGLGSDGGDESSRSKRQERGDAIISQLREAVQKGVFAVEPAPAQLDASKKAAGGRKSGS